MSTHCDDALPLGQHTVYVIGDRSGLPIGVRGAQHEIIGDGSQLRNVKDEDVRGLLVEHGLRNGKGRGL